MQHYLAKHLLTRSPITSAITLAGIVATCLFFIYPQNASAQVMEGDQYKLHLEEIVEDEPTSTPTPLPTAEPLAPSPTPPPLRSYGETEIILSNDFVDFGPLSPTNPVLRQVSFTIRGKYLTWSLYQQMDEDLLSDPGDSIPPTTCDNGSCSENQASVWNSTLSFGLGVRCDNLRGTSCPDDFIPKNTFRSLGQREDTSSIIAQGSSDEINTFNLSYKLVVPGTQAKGVYAGIASYILIPSI
ncbi:MAG: hypothetical protein HYV40_01735 [Candidatus Levybacteria bacterium]|nr:hypothetical protein [Candidatus Levybacteria bacterium]